MTQVAPLPPTRRKPREQPIPVYMTEAEFVDWIPEDRTIRYEWVDGKVEPLAAVSLRHDEIQDWLRNFVQFFVHARELGKVFGDNVQSRLDPMHRRLPDVAFIAADRLGDVLRPNHLEGPPDLCIEVVSPDAPGRDYVVKFKEYQRLGVKEYWIVNYLGDVMDAHNLKGGKFVKTRKTDGRFHSLVLPGLSVDPAWLWKNPMPNVLRVLQEQGVTVEELMAE